ncbi:MAG: hypothetical protein ACRD2U_11700 [Terriglobales bacterium]
MSLTELPPLSSWPSMSVDRYAGFEAATGVKVARIGGIWWQQVRPFLFRPLLPFKKYDVEAVKKGLGRIAVFQSAVEDGQSSNSHLNPVVYEKPQNYDSEKLHRMARRSLKKAFQNSITLSCAADEEEFSKLAYPVYLSFYKRTRYRFNTSRREREKFGRWAHALFQFPEVIVLCACVGQEFIAFEVACLVGNTLILKTLVTSDRALRLGAPDLLLHCYRSGARDHPQIRLIYDSMLSANSGLNNYKVMRGATVLALPAFLNIRPSVLWMIRKASPSVYEKLLGLDLPRLQAEGLDKSVAPKDFGAGGEAGLLNTAPENIKN